MNLRLAHLIWFFKTLSSLKDNARGHRKSTEGKEKWEILKQPGGKERRHNKNKRQGKSGRKYKKKIKTKENWSSVWTILYSSSKLKIWKWK